MLGEAHSRVASNGSAGLSPRPGTGTAFAAPRAAGRLVTNERGPPPDSHGPDVGHWQQETAAAIARRPPVAAGAGVVAWGVERGTPEDASERKAIVTRSSGRQMKTGWSTTTPARPAG